MLFAVASIDRWRRHRSWSEILRGPAAFARIGAAAGAVALVLAIVAATPLIESLGAVVEWSQQPIVRGSAARLFAIGTIVAAAAVAQELALRGWIVERALELRAPAALAIAIGALAEAAVTPGEIVPRVGGAAIGVALGWMYVAAGRNALPSICARLAFVLGATLLEAMRAIG